MRSVLLATTLVAFPIAAFAQSQCVVQAPVAMAAEPTIQLPRPVTGDPFGNWTVIVAVEIVAAAVSCSGKRRNPGF